MNPDNGPKPGKPPRTLHRPTSRQYKLLNKWYQRSPFLFPDKSQELADQLGLPVGRVSNWFGNRRRFDRSRLLDIDPTLRDLNPGLENPHVFAEQFEKHKPRLLRVTKSGPRYQQSESDAAEETWSHSGSTQISFGPICQSSNMTDNSHYEEQRMYTYNQPVGRDFFSMPESANVSQASSSTFFSSAADYDQTPEQPFQLESNSSSSHANLHIVDRSLVHSNLYPHDSSVHFHNPSTHFTQQAAGWWNQSELHFDEGEEQHQHVPACEIRNPMQREASLKFNTQTPSTPLQHPSYTASQEYEFGWYYHEQQDVNQSPVGYPSNNTAPAHYTHQNPDWGNSYPVPPLIPAITQRENMELLPTFDTLAMASNLPSPSLSYPPPSEPATHFYGIPADQRSPSVPGPSTFHCHATSAPVNQQQCQNDGQLTQFQTLQPMKNAPLPFSEPEYEYPFHQHQNNYVSFEHYSSPTATFDSLAPPPDFVADLEERNA